MPAITVHSDSGAQENKICHCSSFPPSICHEVMGPDAMILVFFMLSFKPAFSLSSLTLMKKLFSSSSLSAIKLVSSVYLRLLMKLREESGNGGLKLNIQKMKIMASGPITSWQIDGETMATVTDFIFLGSKITEDVVCSREVKR